MEDQQQAANSSLFQLNLDASNSYTLRSAASWAKVLGVVSIILGILFILMGIVIQSTMSKYSNYGGEFRNSNSLAADFGMIIYVIMGLIFIVAAMFSINFGNRIIKALKTNDQEALSSGFAACRNFFAFWAILTIISLLFMLLGVAGLATQ